MALQTINDGPLAESLFEVFRRYGYEGTTLSLLSEMTGLKKSSLYHRFPDGKDDMVKTVVSHVSEQLHKNLISPLLNHENSPEKRFDNMLVTVKAFYDNGKKNCLLNVLSLGEIKLELNTLLNKDYNDWLTALTNLGMETGLSQKNAAIKSKHFLTVVQGALVLQRLTGDKSIFAESIASEKKHFFDHDSLAE